MTGKMDLGLRLLMRTQINMRTGMFRWIFLAKIQAQSGVAAHACKKKHTVLDEQLHLY